jgi:FkbM family methyltransferase
MISRMSQVMRLRRAVARLLPAPAKAVLRRVLPASIVGWAPRTRRFSIAMPIPPAGLGPAVRGAASPARVTIEAPWRSYVPRLLEAQGVAHYEPETLAAFLAAISLREATEVFDVGANVGVFAIVAASSTTARVTGFEPTPQLAGTFRGVVAANGLPCEVEQIALGAATGTATLFISAQSDSSNSLRKGFRQATGTVEVPVERLDDYVTRTGRRPAVMKIDTETTEPDVLAGGLETLRTVRPWIVCEVLAGKTEEPLTALLRPLGYRFHHLDSGASPVEVEEIVGDRTYRHRDWLFTPEPLPAGFAAHYRAWLAAIEATA